MEIQINAKPLCTIADEFLPDVYQLLGKHSFTFHLDKNKQILNVVNPLHKYQIVMENKAGSMASPLLQMMRETLKHAGFHVWIIETEQDRDRCSEEWDSGKQSMWLTLQPADEEKKEVVVYYFLHQMKASRQLANLLVQNIARYSDMPIQGVSFHWKSGLSYILPQPGQTLNLVGLAYGGFDSMTVEERLQLTDGIVGAATIFFGKKPLMELIKQLRILEERQIEAGYPLPRPAASEAAAGSRPPGPKEEAPALNGETGAKGAADLALEPAAEGLEEPAQPEWDGEEPAEDVNAASEETESVQQARQEALKLETTELNPIRVEMASAEKAQGNELEPIRKERTEERETSAAVVQAVNLAEAQQAEGAEPESLQPEPAEALMPASAAPDSGPAAVEEAEGAVLTAGDENLADAANRVREAAEPDDSLSAERVHSEIQPEQEGAGASGSPEEAAADGQHDPPAEQEAKPRTANYSMFLWLQSHSGNRVRRDPERRQQPQPSFFSYVSQLNQSQQSTDKRANPEPFHMLAMDRERSRKP
ncbi:cytosine deaminase [Paenibacillus dendritiformis]|uniref:cytosine deaminase n=1 Tax=Paenibacillus dendritiformis TaxID=130049 RepID=UPI0018CFDF73|nr:cytosine deaminase [Paenibacillus dendritiformis]MBG9795262.1 cytosine deaminase [Paenibacillus dendritiformis]